MVLLAVAYVSEYLKATRPLVNNNSRFVKSLIDRDMAIRLQRRTGTSITQITDSLDSK